MAKEKEDVKIDRIVLNAGGVKVNLTIEQAKKLKVLLEDMFGKEVIKEVKHEHYYDWWYRPRYIEPYYSTDTPKFGDIVYCSKDESTELKASCLNINL